MKRCRSTGIYEALVHVEITLHFLKTIYFEENLGGSVGEASDFGSGHDLAVHKFEPRVGLCADSSEPGACLGSSVSPSLRPSPAYWLSLKIDKH